MIYRGKSTNSLPRCLMFNLIIIKSESYYNSTSPYAEQFQHKFVSNIILLTLCTIKVQDLSTSNVIKMV